MGAFDALRRAFESTSPAHRVVIGSAILVVVIAGAAFVRWVSAPTYTVLYSGVAESELSLVIDELEAANVPYRLEGGGSRILVPRRQVYSIRADLASAGVQGSIVPQGYELLDEQGLSVSDFRQRIDYQRALEGELARSLAAMASIRTATVHLVIPEEALFEENQEPATASVLVDVERGLDQGEIEAITMLVSSSVGGLEPGNVTVADTAGQILHAAGEDEGLGVGNRQLRMTREFEATMAADISQMLSNVLGPSRASVVVRAQLDFDERSTETETYTPESATPLREQSIEERFTGTGSGPAGTVGVDGESVGVDTETPYDYERNEAITEYGVDRVVVRKSETPGSIERLSVAVVLDDGSLTGADVPDVESISELVAAATGLRADRGDTIEVSAAPFPAPELPTVEEEPSSGPVPEAVLDLLPAALGALVLVAVVAAFLLMSRAGRKARPPEPALPAGRLEEMASQAEMYAIEEDPVSDPVTSEVIDLVENQPQEIAELLRSWLADRRETVR